MPWLCSCDDVECCYGAQCCAPSDIVLYEPVTREERMYCAHCAINAREKGFAADTRQRQ
jgi:hypothetical protein